MGEPSGSPFASDRTGHRWFAVPFRGISFGLPGALNIDPNTAVYFDGTGHFSTELNQNAVSQYTLETWINTLEPISPLIQNRKDAPGSSGNSISVTLTVGFGGPGAQGAAHCGADGDFVWIGASTQLLVNDGKWHHVVCVFSGLFGQPVAADQFKIYVDGRVQPVLLYSTGVPPVAPISGRAGTTLGSHPVWEQAFGIPKFIGIMDEIAIYNYALSPGRILNHYGAAKCPFRCN